MAADGKNHCLLIGHCWKMLAEIHIMRHMAIGRKNQCRLICLVLGIFVETQFAPDIDQSPHSMLRLFTHRKAYDVDRLSTGGD